MARRMPATFPTRPRAPDQGGDAIIGADDDPGGGTSWDDPAQAVEMSAAIGAEAATGAAVAVIGAEAVVTGNARLAESRRCAAGEFVERPPVDAAA